jgi:hypothetical protein
MESKGLCVAWRYTLIDGLNGLRSQPALPRLRCRRKHKASEQTDPRAEISNAPLRDLGTDNFNCRELRFLGHSLAAFAG